MLPGGGGTQGWVLKDGVLEERMCCGPGVLRPLVCFGIWILKVGFGDADKAGHGHH